MTTQTLLDFDLEESSSDSDFRIEDHDDDSDDFSASNEDDPSGVSDSSESDYENVEKDVTNVGSNGCEDTVDLIAESIQTSSKTKRILEKDNTTLLNVSICSVCLGDRSDDTNEIVECDSCGISVHEGCYGIMDSASVSSTVSSCSTEPWFCEACKANKVDPVCELCPNHGGIFKETDVGKWVHLVCALYVPGVAFGEVDQLSSVTLFEMPYSKWGAKTCSICDDGHYARSGVCIGCDAGMCKTYFHVTCAQAAGLLSETHSEEADHADPFYAHCKIHSDKTLIKRRKRNYNTLRMQMNYKTLQIKLKVGKDASPGQQRVERKLKKHRHKYVIHKNIKNEPWVPTQKMPRLLTTSASACRRLILKAKLIDVDTAALEFQETQIASLVDIRKKWHVSPAFSVEFVGYYLDRISRLKEMKRKLQQQLDLNKALINDQDRFRMNYDECVSLQLERNSTKKALCEAIGHLHDTVRALCPNKSLPSVESVSRSPKKTLNPKVSVQVPTRPMSVPTAAALKMGVGFPLTNLPGTSDDTNRILSTQCQQQPTELLNECGICKQINDQHCLAKCDTCKLHYHLGCLSPPLTRHPKKSKIYGWQCSECDEDNPEGGVQLASGPRKSRTKYSKDGTIVPVETNRSLPNGNDTAESALNSSSPLSFQSDKKTQIILENRNKSPQYSTNSPNAGCTNQSPTGSPPANEIKFSKRKANIVKTLAVEDVPSINLVTLPKEYKEIGDRDSTVLVTNIEDAVNISPSKLEPKVKRRKKIKAKGQPVSTTSTAQSASNNINTTVDSVTIKSVTGLETQLSKSKSNQVDMEALDIADSEYKLNRKRRKEKHRSKERSERSSSKERKKKRKRKNHDERKLSDTFSMADGVPKIKIKFKSMPLPGEQAAEPQCFYVPANMVRPRDFSRSRPASVDTMNDEITSMPVHLSPPMLSPPPPSSKSQVPVASKTPSLPIRTRRLSVLLSPAKTINKRCATPLPNTGVNIDGAVISSVTRMHCDACNECGTTADLVKCDDCQKNYHFRCLVPPLKKTPKRRGYSWHCADCDPTDKEDK